MKLVVTGATATTLAMLSGIVLGGSRTIETRRSTLEAKIAELQELMSQNASLRHRVQRASRRAAAKNERYLRRIGADLHDGPAQLVALGALRMDSPLLLDPTASSINREAEIADLHHTLDEAMREIRAIRNGTCFEYWGGTAGSLAVLNCQCEYTIARTNDLEARYLQK